MTIQVSLYDTATLLGVMREMEPPSNYWLNLCFPRQVTFEDEYIDFEKIAENRKLAPFVAPTAQGRPIYAEGSTVTRFQPAYVKPKDVVNPNRQLRRRPGDLLGASSQTPQSRYNAVIADIMRDHRNSIERRWEWLAAQAIIHGEVTIVDDDYPERYVSFGRDPNHTINLTGPAQWTTTSDIIGDIEEWRTMVRRARFGGPTNRLTVGVDVWDVMRQNTGVLKQLDTQIRGTQGQFITGVREGLDVEFVGRLSNTLDIYVYNDYYQAPNGDVVEFMSPRDVILTGPNVGGARCFGAILDNKANLQALPIFSKMWDQEDPSATFVMSQSAPLMVPVNPNNTLRATVLQPEESA